MFRILIKFTVLKTEISVSPLFFAVTTAFLLINKNGMALKVLLSAFLHEMGHFIALLCVKTAPRKAELSLFGIRLNLKNNMSTAQKCIVLMAGFAVNFIVSAICFLLKENILAYINLIIGIFTALPLSSSDGGTIFKIILEEFLPQKAEKLFEIISLLLVFIISLFLIFVSVSTKNYYIIIAVVYMIFCTKRTATG